MNEESESAEYFDIPQVDRSESVTLMETHSAASISTPENVSSTTAVFFIGAVNQNEPPWTIELKICDKSLLYKIDTGADVSVMSAEIYNSLGPKPKLSKSHAILCSPGGVINCLGTFKVSVRHCGTDFPVEMYAISGKTDNLLSREASTRMNLVKRLDSMTINPKVFGELTETPVKCEPVRISLADNSQPYSVSSARRVPIPLLDKVKNELTRMQRAGIIEEIREPTEWCAPMVPVQEKTAILESVLTSKDLTW